MLMCLWSDVISMDSRIRLNVAFSLPADICLSAQCSILFLTAPWWCSSFTAASTDTIVARNWHQINVSDKNILQLALGLCPTITVEPKKDTKHTQVFKDDQAWWTGCNISRDWLITTKTRSVGRRLLVKFLSRRIWSNNFLDSGWGEMALCCVLIGTFFKPKMG